MKKEVRHTPRKVSKGKRLGWASVKDERFRNSVSNVQGRKLSPKEIAARQEKAGTASSLLVP